MMLCGNNSSNSLTKAGRLVVGQLGLHSKILSQKRRGGRLKASLGYMEANLGYMEASHQSLQLHATSSP